MPGFFNTLFGGGDRVKQVSNLSKPQQQLFNQFLQMMQGGEQMGGPMGQMMNYYQGLMEPGSESEQAFEAPMMRQFNEQIIPGLSEQFAGMGSGGLSSSSFRNAAVGAGTDLSERLAQMRANLRQQGVGGIQGLMGTAFQPTFSNYMQRGSSGIIPGLAGSILGTEAGGQGFMNMMGGAGRRLGWM